MKVLQSIAFCLALAPAAAIAAPAALVLDVEGEVSPAVQLFDEIPPGTELALSPGARLMLEHYESCEAAVIAGGTVTVRPLGLDLDGAQVVERRRVDCPKVIEIAGDTVTAGVILRSVLPVQRVGLAPTIVVAGDGAGIEGMTIERDGREVASLPVQAGRVQWPAGGLFLSDGARYVFILRGGPAEHRVDVLAARDGAERVVLRPTAG